MSWRSQSSWSAKWSASVSGPSNIAAKRRDHRVARRAPAGISAREASNAALSRAMAATIRPVLVAEALHQRRRRDAGRLGHLGQRESTGPMREHHLRRRVQHGLVADGLSARHRLNINDRSFMKRERHRIDMAEGGAMQPLDRTGRAGGRRDAGGGARHRPRARRGRREGLVHRPQHPRRAGDARPAGDHRGDRRADRGRRRPGGRGPRRPHRRGRGRGAGGARQGRGRPARHPGQRHLGRRRR